MNELSLRIFGGELDQGFNQHPIIAVGYVTGAFQPISPTLVDEDTSWMMVNDRFYTLYAYYSKLCNTQEGKQGHILVCLFVPDDSRIAEKSPLEALETVTELFVSKYMPDGILPSNFVNDEDFADLLEGFAVIEKSSGSYYYIMGGANPASFCVESLNQLKALTLYNSYPVLASISRLEIGLKCQSTIDIPMKVKFKTTLSETKKTWREKWAEKEKEKAERERLAKEKEERERVERGKAANESLERKRAEKEGLTLTWERMENDKVEEERPPIAKDGKESISLERERLEDERIVREKIKKEKPVVEEKPKEEIFQEDDSKANVKKTEIGNVPFPLQPKYEVFVNGNSTGRFLQDQFDYYRAEIAGKDNTDIDVRYGFLNFTLGELLDSKTKTKQSQDGTVVVRLDEELQRIDCTLKPIPVSYKKVLRFTHNSNDEAKKFFRNGLKDHSVKLMLNGKEWVNAEIKPSEAIAAIRDNHIDVFPHEVEGYRFSVDSVNLYDPEKGVVVTIKAKKVQRWQKRLIIGGIVALAVGIGGTILVWKVAESISIERDAYLEFSAYQNADASNDTIIWKNYLEQYSAPKFKHPVEKHLSEITGKLNQARLEAINHGEKLAALNRNDIDSFMENGEGCLTNEEYSAGLWLLTGCGWHHAYIDIKDEGYSFEQRQELAKTIEKSIKPYKKGDGFDFKNWEKVNEACRGVKISIETKAHVYWHQNREIKMKTLLDLVNNQDLKDFRVEVNKNKINHYYTHDDINAGEWILNYQNLLHHRKEGPGPVHDKHVEIMISHYLKDELGFPNKPFESWDEVLKAKKRIDEIVRMYEKNEIP